MHPGSFKLEVLFSLSKLSMDLISIDQGFLTPELEASLETAEFNSNFLFATKIQLKLMLLALPYDL